MNRTLYINKCCRLIISIIKLFTNLSDNILTVFTNLLINKSYDKIRNLFLY